MWSGEVAADGEVVARWLFTDRGEPAVGRYGKLNIASHVGDDLAKVEASRREALALIGCEPALAVWPSFCHSTHFAKVSHGGEAGEVDGLITTERSVALVTMGADCVPLIAVDPLNRIAVAAHIGWRGAAHGMVDELTRQVNVAGGDVQKLRVWLGPAICADCYQVNAERRGLVGRALPAAVVDGGLDLRRGIESKLAALGAEVQQVGPCTFESTSLFSFRRDGVTGRQGGFLVLV